ncbi:MAG: DNA topoisomerase 3 [Sphaerochaetaceae bacterium]
MKNLVLAEKPSIGRELSHVLGCKSQNKYFENEEYVVTWALGHLVSPASPNYYSPQYRKWSLGTLPILPEKLENLVIEKTKEQYKIVEGLLNREDISTIIIATDAGREGELVARWIIQQAKCNKPLLRLWISSQTEIAIKTGFANLKSGDDYLNLYHAAECRSAADWYIGYNISRALSCFYDTPLSAGRVQTPTLALITQREDEIDSFSGNFYWTIRADFGAFKASYYSSPSSTRIEDKELALKIQKDSQNAKAKIVDIAQETKTETPPLAYSLTSLQQDANNILNFSAKQTLDTLQRLYEIHKIVTYPRTDSHYISDDIIATFPDRLKALSTTEFGLKATKLALEGTRKDLSRFVQNELVSDHHAIIPTEQKVNLSKLNKNEKDLWTLIAIRFLEVLSEDYTYQTITLTLDIENHNFISRFSTPISLGWKEISKEADNKFKTLQNDEYEVPPLTTLNESSALPVQKIILKKTATTPPDRYTEATLLFAMEHAGKFVEDKEQKRNLTNGIGTPATRADIIEKLINSHCMERKDRYLFPTPKGRELIRLVPSLLKSPELTANWEMRLSKIADGSEEVETFIKDIKTCAHDLVNQVTSSHLTYDPKKMGEKTCPFCSWPMIKVTDEYGQIHNICQRFSCGYEECETKVRVKVEDKKQVVIKKATTKTVKPVIQTQAVVVNGKKKIIVKKTNTVKKLVATPIVEYTWKTELKVVKPSHFKPNNNYKTDYKKDYKKKFETEKTPSKPIDKKFTPSQKSTGGTFADFIAASNARKEKDKEKKKKKNKK